MMFADGLAHGAGAAVDHHPELILLVGLEFDEMVSAAERGELESAFVAADRFKVRMAQGCPIQRLRRCDRRAAMPAG